MIDFWYRLLQWTSLFGPWPSKCWAYINVHPTLCNMYISHYQSTKRERKKQKYVFSHLSLKLKQGHITQAPLIRCISSRRQIENNLQKKELPRIHPVRMATGGAVTRSVWEQREGLSSGHTVRHQCCLEHKQQYPCPAWWQRCFLRPLMCYDFELCSWQRGLQAYFLDPT